MTRHQPVKGIILDVDGTLIDSNKAHTHAWVEAMKENGYDVPFEKVGPLIGMGGDKVLPEVLHLSKDSPEGKKIGESRKKIFKEKYFSTVKAFPGTAELLHHMHDKGLRLAIATSAEPDELHEMLKIIEPHIDQLFEQEATSKDANQSKPDPDIIHATIKRIGLDPHELLMIGDTAYDIEAASKASLSTIAFRSGGWSDKDLAGALAIYDGPEDLLKQYDQSPLSQGI
ncbi:phosphoglycolate phosphatase [Dictyobacter vulcani]|uniref:Phosphoglycolate phosphatase n=1 Tax=Dictyobacter vulcani TaxID=2607529 RepID=A0A5J4KG92_9CHLR|nr:HAD family hydrolase [Dictyobacter vulcani]GER88494.1 phosphoglycolate phosphatase [Dictyobacter vulcani]